MAQLDTAEGGCLCGNVRFTARNVRTKAGACHCQMCRKSSGGIFLAAKAERIGFADNKTLGLFKSSEWGERGFCNQCGSTLFWRMQDGSRLGIALGAFDDPAPFTLDHELFIEAKPACYSFAQETKTFTEAELMALIGAGGSI